VCSSPSKQVVLRACDRALIATRGDELQPHQLNYCRSSYDLSRIPDLTGALAYQQLPCS
jgi:hypothetical protein